MKKEVKHPTTHDVIYATFWSRVLAHNIDLVILIIPLFILRQVIIDETILYTIAALLYFIYHICFEWSSWNGSPGKKLVRIQVMDSSLSDPTFTQVTLRNLYKIISILPFLLGFTMANFSKRKQALHDWLSHTITIIPVHYRKFP